MKASAPVEVLQGDDGKHYIVVQQDGVEGPICVELSDEQYYALQNDNTEVQIEHSSFVVQSENTEDQSQFSQDESQSREFTQDESQLQEFTQDESQLQEFTQDESQLQEFTQDESQHQEYSQDESHVQEFTQDESQLEKFTQDESQLEKFTQDESQLQELTQNESQLEFCQDESQLQDQSQSLQDHLQDSIESSEVNKEQKNVDAGDKEWLEDELAKDLSQSQHKLEANVKSMDGDDSSKNKHMSTTLNYMNKSNSPRTFSDVFREQMINPMKQKNLGKRLLISPQAVPVKKQRILNEALSTKQKNGHSNNKPTQQVANTNIQTRQSGRSSSAGLQHHIINDTLERGPKKTFTANQVMGKKIECSPATTLHGKISVSQRNNSPVINNQTVTSSIKRNDKNIASRLSTMLTTKKNSNNILTRSKTTVHTENNNITSSRKVDFTKDATIKSIPIKPKDKGFNSSNDDFIVGSSGALSHIKPFEPKDKDLSAFNDDASVSSGSTLSHSSYKHGVQLQTNIACSGYDTDDFLHDGDQLSSSDEEECDFSLDVRRERASEFVPMLGDYASEVLNNENTRLESSLATLSKDRSEVKRELSITMEEVKQLRLKLQALDKRLEQV